MAKADVKDVGRGLDDHREDDTGLTSVHKCSTKGSVSQGVNQQCWYWVLIDNCAFGEANLTLCQDIYPTPDSTGFAVPRPTNRLQNDRQRAHNEASKNPPATDILKTPARPSGPQL